MTEHVIIGPEGRIHLNYSKGCYYHRTVDCCPICMVRVLGSTVGSLWK
jgi:hypothetical protein